MAPSHSKEILAVLTMLNDEESSDADAILDEYIDTLSNPAGVTSLLGLVQTLLDIVEAGTGVSREALIQRLALEGAKHDDVGNL